MIELASRDTGTLHVALLWARGTDRFSVRVDDPATGVNFELPVDDGTALDVYSTRTHTRRPEASTTTSPRSERRYQSLRTPK